MTLKEARQIFKEEYAEFIRKNKTDKIAVNLAYTYFLDGLTKEGQLTQRQWENASNFVKR